MLRNLSRNYIKRWSTLAVEIRIIDITFLDKGFFGSSDLNTHLINLEVLGQFDNHILEGNI